MAMLNVPLCYRFNPRDSELVEFFLIPKANGLALPEGHPILERVLYGKEAAAPWNVFKDDDPWEWVDDTMTKKILYVFSRVIAKNGESKSRMDRTTESGTWDGKAVGKPIRGLEGNVLGYKRAYTFKPKKEFENETKGKWVLHEYSLTNTNDYNDGDLVVCRISNHVEKEGSGNKDERSGLNSDAASNSVAKRSRVEGTERVSRGVSTDQMGDPEGGQVAGANAFELLASVSTELRLNNQQISFPCWGFTHQNENREVVPDPAATRQDTCNTDTPICMDQMGNQECGVVGVDTFGPSTNVSLDLCLSNQEIVNPSRGLPPQNESQEVVPHPAAASEDPYSSDTNERSIYLHDFFK